MTDEHDEYYMRLALAEAQSGLDEGEFPFGAVLVARKGEVVASCHDTVERDGDKSSHAETMLVKRSCRLVGPDLTGCTLYTTVEPCPMCFTTSWLARVSRIAWGATMAEVADATHNAVRELAVPATQMNDLGGQLIDLRGGVLCSECIGMFNKSAQRRGQLG